MSDNVNFNQKPYLITSPLLCNVKNDHEPHVWETPMGTVYECPGIEDGYAIRETSDRVGRRLIVSQEVPSMDYLQAQIAEAARAQSKALDQYLVSMASALGLTHEELAEQYILEIHRPTELFAPDARFVGEGVFKISSMYRLVPRKTKENE